MNTPDHRWHPPKLFPVLDQLPLSFGGRLECDHSPPPISISGEVALLWAVLEDAVMCFERQFVAYHRHTRRIAREAEEWLFRDDHHWPFSFINICARLRLEPEYIRRGLKQWSRTPPIIVPRQRRHAATRRRSLRVTA